MALPLMRGEIKDQIRMEAARLGLGTYIRGPWPGQRVDLKAGPVFSGEPDDPPGDGFTGHSTPELYCLLKQLRVQQQNGRAVCPNCGQVLPEGAEAQ